MSLALQCPECRSAPVGRASFLRWRCEGAVFCCEKCGAKAPVETAYFGALCSYPFTNAIFVANCFLHDVVELMIGVATRINFGTDVFDKLHYVNASANAPFPVTVAVVDPTPEGFTLVSSTHQPSVPTESIRAAWMAAGYKGRERHLFLEAMSRAFEVLHRGTMRSQPTLRSALLETAIAYEIFQAWYLRTFVWTDAFFAQSKNKSDLVSDIVREAGATNLTQVPLRVGLASLNITRIFDVHKLPIVGGLITRDSLLADILQGIRLRNSVVHRGSRELQADEVERFAGAVYFLMEAVLVNLPWEGHEPEQSQS